MEVNFETEQEFWPVWQNCTLRVQRNSTKKIDFFEKKNEGTSGTNCGIKAFLREVLLLKLKKKRFFLKNSRPLSITRHFTEYLAISVWQGLNDFSSIAGKVSTQSCFFFERSKVFVNLVFEIQQKQSFLLS